MPTVAPYGCASAAELAPLATVCRAPCKKAQKNARPWIDRTATAHSTPLQLEPLTEFKVCHKLTSGSSKELDVHSGTINAVCEQYAKSRYLPRHQFHRVQLPAEEPAFVDDRFAGGFSALGGTTGSLITAHVFGNFSGHFSFYLTLCRFPSCSLACFSSKGRSTKVRVGGSGRL